MHNVLLLLITIVGSATAQNNGDLRLSGPNSTYRSGRLEIYYNGQWGTVCNDYWDISDSIVACRQLGLTGTVSPYYRTSSDTRYGPGTGQIWLDDVACSGSESRLASCSNRGGFGSHNCDHFEDVAIYCSTTLAPRVSNAVGIGVGVSITGLVVFVIVPIVICVVIAIAASRRHTRTTATTVPSATPSSTAVTRSSQQQSAQQGAYPAARTDIKQPPSPPYEMSAYPSQPQQGYPQQGYPQQGYPQQGHPAYPPQP